MFSHCARPETNYWHPCQCFNTIKKAHSRNSIPTVPDGFVLPPCEPAYFTYDSGIKWRKSNFGRLVQKTTEKFLSCAGRKRKWVSSVVQTCKPFCSGISPLSSQAFQKRLQVKGLRRKIDSERTGSGEPTRTEHRFFFRLRRSFCARRKACVHRNEFH